VPVPSMLKESIDALVPRGEFDGDMACHRRVMSTEDISDDDVLGEEGREIE
jgi:hypothetical protein